MSIRSAASPSSSRDRSPLLQQYGSEDTGLLPTMAHSTPLRPQQQGLLKKSSIFYALNGVALLALLSVCVSMHSTITRLESQVATQTTSSHAKGVPPEAAIMRASRRHRPAHKHDEDDDEELVVERLPMVFLPSKFAVDYVTPRQNQAHRGTCWDFATVGFLEQSYRQNGVQNGWLAEDEYVAFSEQAYGVEILNLCTGPADSPQQKACRVAGDAVWENSTEGGEVPVLYYLREGLQESIFPQSVCKYYENDGNDTLCPGMEAARKLNPLKFSVKGMDTKYEDMSVREHLFRKKQAMPLSTPVAMVTHYYPCIGSFASDLHCQPDHCTLCPPELAMTTCCVPMKGGSNRNMEGEFFSHHGMSIEGGHAMLLVGYNDAFLTREGFTGGLIVKNSWSDGPTQGSHSLAYWMQEVSDWEERTVCPNSWNPFNWYQCGNEGVNSRKGSVGDANSTETFNERIQECLSEETQIFAETNVQPLHLKCKDAKQCKTDGDFVYFVRNTTDWGDRMTVMCLWEYSAEQHIAREVCLKPMLELQIARTLAPVAVETKENDTDRCGFYFIPYEALRKWIMQFQGFFVNSFELEWDPRSYAANKEDYEEFDYSLLEASTKKQNTSHFLGPFPYAQVVESFRKN